MPIEKLKELVAPPSRPVESGSLELWRQAEQKLGLALPKDYRDFVLACGTGLFAKFYMVYNPFSVSEWMNLQICIERVCNAARETKRDWPKVVPYRIQPESPGLLPWGGDENGNYYYWFTDGPPNTWAILSDEVRGEGFREYGRTMSDFLGDVLTGKIQALAGDYPKKSDRIFQPWKPEDK